MRESGKRCACVCLLKWELCVEYGGERIDQDRTGGTVLV